MATDLEKLVVQLSADFKSFEKSLARANDVTNKQFNAIERRAKQLNKNLDGIFTKSFGNLTAPLAGIGAALGVDQLRKMTDTWTDMTSRVNLAAGSVEKGTEVMGRLGEMARRTYSDLSQTTESYLANATALKELGYSTNQSLDYTEALNNALVVSGAKGQRAETVMDALAKAMALGKLSGDNLNTVIAQGGRVAEALAAGLGTTVGGLRALGAQGKITGNDVVKALSSQMETLRKEAADMPATIGDGFTLLNNALLEYVGNADHATGISAKVSEALVMIADNFDQVADSTLQVAAVIAGALVGRSLGGMIRSLGLAGTALNNFVRALAAARTMGNMATALGGLGTAAGPLGAIIGGALVLSLGSYAKASWDAAKSSDDLRSEMERLGLIASKAATGVDDVAESLDKLTEAGRARKLKQINDEIERLRSGGGLFGKGDELNTIAAEALHPLRGILGQFQTSDIDKDARRSIAQMATDFAGLKISADDVKARLEAIKNTDVSEGVAKLADKLRETVDAISATEAYSTRFGDTLEQNIGKVAEEIQNLKGYLEEAAASEIISQEQYNELSKLVDEFTRTGNGAKELRQRLKDIEKANPNFNWLMGEFDSLINKMQVAIKTAQAAGRAMHLAYGSGQDIDKANRATADPYVIQRNAENAAAAEYERNAIRKAKLGKKEFDLENEIARVKKQSLADGAKLTEDQIKRIAEANLAGNASRTSETKKPKKERDDNYERLTKQITDRTASLVAETEAQRQINPLIDDYGYATEKARASQELLNAAQKAGVKITPELRREIEATAEQWALATAEANRLSEAQDKIRQRAQEWQDAEKDALRGVVDDLIAGKSAADAFASALKKIADKLMDMAFDDLFTGLFKNSGGGLFSGLLGLLGGGASDPWAGLRLADGGHVRGPGTARSDSIPARLSDGEYVVNARATKQFRPLLDAINSGKALKLADGGLASFRAPTMPRLQAPASQAGPSITFAPVIDARGADVAAVERLAQVMDKQKREFEANVISTIRNARSRRVPGI